MARIVCFVVVFGTFSCLLLVLGGGTVLAPRLAMRIIPIWFVMLVLILSVFVSVIGASLYHLCQLVRGRRNRDAGIPCIHCHRLAFPMEGSATRYRCWMCGSRFDGPEHF
jgi:hypothetical protein